MEDTMRRKIVEGLEEIMRPPVSVSPDAPAREVLKILLENKAPGVPVVEDGKLVGFVSDGHLLDSALPRYLSLLGNASFVSRSGDGWVGYFRDAADRPVREIMSREVARMEIGSSIFAAAHEMKRKGVSSLIVTRGGAVVGIVNRLDLYADIEGIELS